MKAEVKEKQLIPEVKRFDFRSFEKSKYRS
ncbi:hypothetical protein C8C77_11930 [Halanaerobium saccharolyticum]|uniref:Uncharacterized protein n=1 Tax=Halanaerobium saccharolyticum TaxID=43595 RepID=A0A4R7YWJ1_9FIRM|nr:hypothetical protein C7958_11830 [Halanaerobium saccharolyticum]TDW01667.1 hypothetical protein C8C77_11930 [Halanaerobium saccharolyticum]TDX53065.1 hypothetical protein C7956_11930 [Halanaerobium saccharolyticum]